ncbi:MAG: TolC family protein [Deltaproteobacteria bacterium]|nr:TolC family protein [Deltaproteobacteria bacterium]
MKMNIPKGVKTDRKHSVVLLAVTLAIAQNPLLGCGGTYESVTRDDLATAATIVEREQVREESESSLEGSLSSYLAFAVARSPELRASFERWRAATMRISRARRMPEPIIKYSYFVRSVETRVGPQNHRLSLMQSFPWPTGLSAGADAASAAARAAQRRFDAELLGVKQAVADAYWRLWLIHEDHRLKMEHDLVLETLAGSVRGRVRTGDASLADLNQVELGIARHHDHHGAHREAERVAAAELLRAIGASSRDERLMATDAPFEGLPTDDDEALRRAARQHPHIEAAELMASSSDSQVRAEAAKRAPSLLAGLDWIVTGKAPTVVEKSGQDAVIVTAGLSVPLWGRSYRDAMAAERAEGAAYLADRDAALYAADAQLEAAMAGVRDAQRRIELYRNTLIPQAETTFQSVLGGYQSGRSTVASALLAQKDLLELQLELARSRTHHARAWAVLEAVVGRPVTPTETGEQP